MQSMQSNLCLLRSLQHLRQEVMILAFVYLISERQEQWLCSKTSRILMVSTLFALATVDESFSAVLRVINSRHLMYLMKGMHVLRKKYSQQKDLSSLSTSRLMDSASHFVEIWNFGSSTDSKHNKQHH